MSWLKRLDVWNGRTVSLPKETRSEKKKRKSSSKKRKTKPRKSKPKTTDQKRSVQTHEVISYGGSRRGRRVPKKWDARLAEREGQESCSNVYTATTRRAQACMSARPILQERASNGEWINSKRVRSAGEDLQEIIKRPNNDFTWGQMMELASISLDLAGNALITKIPGLRLMDGGNGTIGLSPIPPAYMHPRANDEEGLLGYEILRGKKRGQIVPSEEVIHPRYPSLSEPFWGLAPLKAASLAVDADVAAACHNSEVLKRGMYPSGLISMKGDLKPTTLKNAHTDINEQYGVEGEGGEILVLGGDAKFTQFGLSPEQLMSLDIRRFSRDEIFRVIGIPPIIAGVYDDSSYNNMQTAREVFWVMYIMPQLDMIYGAIERSLQREYGDDFRIWYSVDHLDFLASITLDQANVAEKFFNMGVPLTELNRRFKLGFDESAFQSTGSANTSDPQRSIPSSPPQLTALPGGKR